MLTTFWPKINAKYPGESGTLMIDKFVTLSISYGIETTVETPDARWKVIVSLVTV